jgi:hypothetical protein
MTRRRTYKIPLSGRQAASFIKAARASNFVRVSFETSDGLKITVDAKSKADDGDEARDASMVAKQRIEQMRANKRAT